MTISGQGAVCPIKGVSEDCEECPMIGWGYCVYVKLWQERKKGKSTKISSYIPLVERNEE